MAAAAIDQPKQSEQLRPRAEALIHGVGVAAIVDLEPLVEARDRVIFRENFVGGKQAAVFGIENEDHSQKRGEQSPVYAVGIGGEHIAQKQAVGLIVGSLKPAQQLVECFKDLVGELRGDDVLVLAAVFENRRQALFLGDTVEPLRIQQHVEGGEDRPACDTAAFRIA